MHSRRGPDLRPGISKAIRLANKKLREMRQSPNWPTVWSSGATEGLSAFKEELEDFLEDEEWRNQKRNGK